METVTYPCNASLMFFAPLDVFYSHRLSIDDGVKNARPMQGKIKSGILYESYALYRVSTNERNAFDCD